MKIYKPRGVTRGQFVLVATLGVFSGVYIWKPLFDEHFPRKNKPLDNPDTGSEPELTEK